MELVKIKPMYTKLVTTMDMYTEANATLGGGIIDATKLKKGIKEFLKVVAVGDSVRTVKVGDLVCINPSRYAVMKYGKNSVKSDLEELTNHVVNYNFNVVNLDGQDCLMLDESDIDFIILEHK